MALIAFGFSHILWLSIVILPLVGFGLMQQMAPSNTILQTIVHDEKRGRVMSFYGMAFLGMVPFGSLLAGYLAAKIGAPQTMMVNGAVCLIGSLWFARKTAGDPADRAAHLCADGDFAGGACEGDHPLGRGEAIVLVACRMFGE